MAAGLGEIKVIRHIPIFALLVFLFALLAPLCAQASEPSGKRILEQLILEERERRERERVTDHIREPVTGQLDPIRASESAARFTNILLKRAQAWALPVMIISWIAGFALWIGGAVAGASKNKGPAVILLGTVGFTIIQAAPIIVGVFLNFLERLVFT